MNRTLDALFSRLASSTGARRWIRRILLSASACLAAAATFAQPVVSPAVTLPGDAVIGLSVETQEWPQISAGDDGYLVVWQDMRPVLSGTTNAPSSALVGNNWDIYAALLDAEGNVVKSPIVITQRGKNDTRPRVGWNGSEWLVVWTSERPDWYFFEDIVGARVSADGVVLDEEAIIIRPEHNQPANDLAENPRVASDGTDWVIVWEAITWEGFSGDLNLTGRRMLADGTFPEPERILYQFEGIVFGPEDPQIAWGGDQYLLAWEDFGDLRAQRFDATLRPIDAEPIDVTNIGTNPRLATNGTDFLIVTADYRGYRITADGEVLDPAGGIDFDIGGNVFQPDGPNVAWDGENWAVAFGSGEGFVDSDAYFLKIAPNGAIVPPGAVIVQATPENEWQPALASLGDGTSQIVWVEAFPEDILARRVEASGDLSPVVDLGVGQRRQSGLRYATNGDEHLAVYRSEGDGTVRILAQRVHKTGGAIDPEPVVVTEYDEGALLPLDVAFDGTFYLVAWTDSSGFVWGQRLAADGTLVDTFPRIIVSTDLAGDIGVGALDGRFLVTYTHTFSGDQRNLKAVRVRSSDMTVLDNPFTIGLNFAKEPRAAALGGRWLVVWEDQTNHDTSSSSTAGVFVDFDGQSGGSFAIDQSGFGDDPDVAVLEDEVLGEIGLVVWYDNANFGDSFVEGRVVAADGSFLTSEFLIADAPNDQLFTRVGVDGDQFVAAWTDFRSVEGVEALRGDIWAARVAPDGEVIDLGGFQVTAGVLPEDLPDVAGADDRALLGFSALAGEHEREVQRISHQVLGQGLSLTVSGACPGELTIELAGGEPFADLIALRGSEAGSSVVPAGDCAGVPLDLSDPARLGTLQADADGGLTIVRTAGAGLCGASLQFLDASSCERSFLVEIPASE